MLGAGSNARRSVRIGWPVPSALKSPTTACFYIIIYLAQCTYILELERGRDKQISCLFIYLAAVRLLSCCNPRAQHTAAAAIAPGGS
jgi:hypothetical protein